MSARPSLGFGMRHVALFVRDLDAGLHFYCDLLGMQIEWQPDDDNYYLTSGGDNLALHRAAAEQQRDETTQRLDHIGFFVESAEEVDAWFAWLTEHNVQMRTQPRTHRDGARSFYCYDPDGTVVQVIHHPPVTDWEKLRGVN
jgi:catechol 2,3-dioxygenase-like lactoylglutathione lyase family enzyme